MTSLDRAYRASALISPNSSPGSTSVWWPSRRSAGMSEMMTVPSALSPDRCTAWIAPWRAWPLARQLKSGRAAVDRLGANDLRRFLRAGRRGHPDFDDAVLEVEGGVAVLTDAQDRLALRIAAFDQVRLEALQRAVGERREEVDTSSDGRSRPQGRAAARARRAAAIDSDARGRLSCGVRDHDLRFVALARSLGRLAEHLKGQRDRLLLQFEERAAEPLYGTARPADWRRTGVLFATRDERRERGDETLRDIRERGRRRERRRRRRRDHGKAAGPQAGSTQPSAPALGSRPVWAPTSRVRLAPRPVASRVEASPVPERALASLVR